MAPFTLFSPAPRPLPARRNSDAAMLQLRVADLRGNLPRACDLPNHVALTSLRPTIPAAGPRRPYEHKANNPAAVSQYVNSGVQPAWSQPVNARRTDARKSERAIPTHPDHYSDQKDSDFRLARIIESRYPEGPIDRKQVTSELGLESKLMAATCHSMAIVHRRRGSLPRRLDDSKYIGRVRTAESSDASHPTPMYRLHRQSHVLHPFKLEFRVQSADGMVILDRKGKGGNRDGVDPWTSRESVKPANKVVDEIILGVPAYLTGCIRHMLSLERRGTGHGHYTNDPDAFPRTWSIEKIIRSVTAVVTANEGRDLPDTQKGLHLRSQFSGLEVEVRWCKEGEAHVATAYPVPESRPGALENREADIAYTYLSGLRTQPLRDMMQRMLVVEHVWSILAAARTAHEMRSFATPQEQAIIDGVAQLLCINETRLPLHLQLIDQAEAPAF